MTAGYWAAILWLAAAVLWWSGWRKELAGNISPRAATLFFALWPAGWLAGVWLPPGSRTAMAAAALVATAVLACRSLGPGGRLGIWSATALGAAVLLIATHPAVWLGGPLAIDPERNVALLLGIAAALTLRTAREQLVVLSLLLPAAVFAGMRSWSPPGWPAPEYLADMWWLACAACRAVSLALREMGPALLPRRGKRAGNRA